MSGDQFNIGQQYITFGKKKIELGKSDGVKKETFDNFIANNKALNSIFNKFDKNSDGKLDNIELNNVYQQYLEAAKDGKMSKKEVKQFAQQLGLENGNEDMIEQFLEAVGKDDDQFSAQWEDNTYTEKDGNKTIIREYSDAEHTHIAAETVKEGNTTTITQNNEDGKVVTTTVGNGDNIISKKVEKYDANNIKTEEEIVDANGKKTIKKYDKDGNYTVTEGSVVKKYDKDNNLLQEHIDYTKVPSKNQGMIIFLALSNQNTVVDNKYMNTLAKFPDVSLNEVADLMREYPNTTPMLIDYFSSDDAQKTQTNFEKFLNNLDIDYEAEGYKIGYITRNINGETIYAPTLYYEGKPVAKSEMPVVFKDLLTT